jgi:hypothetical protein
MRHYKTLIALMLLTACTTAPRTPPPEPAPAPDSGASLAGFQILFEATGVAFRATVAVATEEANRADSIRTSTAAAATSQAEQFNFSLTQGAATQQWRETELSFGATVAAATAQPQATQQAATATIAAQAIALQSKRQSDEIYWWIGVLFTVAACGLILYFLARIGRAIANKLTPDRDPNQVRVVRTTMGILILAPTANGVHRELLALPAATPAMIGDADPYDTDEEGAEEVPFYDRGNLVSTKTRSQADADHAQRERNRRDLLKFLTKAIEAQINGRQSNVIPRSDKMGVSTMQWQRLTALIGDQLEKRVGRNGGTFLIGQYPTLGELAEAIGERRYIPYLTIEGKSALPSPPEVVEGAMA